MSTAQIADLETVIRESGEGWLLDWFGPRDKAMEHIRSVLGATSQRARARLGNNAPDLSEASIVREYFRNPQRVRGFFQALGGSRTPEMLLMVWRLIQGMEIKEMEISYRRQQQFTLRVVLASPYDVEDAPYETQNVHDFGLLRHLGVMEIDGRPVFDGFYALRLPN